MKRANWALSALLLAAVACADPVAEREDAAVLSLRSGTSFGMCAGYCLTELIVEDATARFVETAWPTTSLPSKTRTRTLSQEEQNQLRSLIDLAELEQLEGVHGCPDCADGGAEWIELRTGDDTIRVTFEFGRDLAPIEDLQSAIRALRSSFPPQ